MLLYIDTAMCAFREGGSGSGMEIRKGTNVGKRKMPNETRSQISGRG